MHNFAQRLILALMDNGFMLYVRGGTAMDRDVFGRALTGSA